MLALTLLLTACAPHGECNDYVLFGEHYTEACGLADSFGFLYFEDTMVHLLLAPGLDQGGEINGTVYDYLPGFTLGFRTAHLVEGAALGPEQIVATCHRSTDQFGYLYTWPTDDVALEVVGPYDRDQIGGQSWHFRWHVGCPEEANLSGEGDDQVELIVEATGYDFELYGVPDDWPDEW